MINIRTFVQHFKASHQHASVHSAQEYHSKEETLDDAVNAGEQPHLDVGNEEEIVGQVIHLPAF